MKLKHFLSVMLFIASLTTVTAQFNTPNQALNIGGTTTDQIHSVAFDNDGNKIIVGTFKNTVDFDPSEEEQLISSVGISDFFVQKLSSTGELVWIKTISGDFENKNLNVVYGDAIYIGGEFEGEVDFDPNVGEHILSSQWNLDRQDIFLLKLNDAGNFQWMKRTGSAEHDYCKDIAYGNGKIYFVGSYTASMLYEEDDFPLYLPSWNDSYDGFIMGYTASGTYCYLDNIQGSENIEFNSIAHIEDGLFYVSGEFRGEVNFYNEIPITSAACGSDVFVIKKDLSNYNILNFWIQTFVSTGDDTSNDLAVDDEGNMILTGAFHNSLVVGDTELNSIGESDIYTLKMDIDQNILWANQTGNEYSNTTSRIAIGNNNRILLGGDFQYNLSIDGNPNSFALNHQGEEDIFLQHMKADGQLIVANSLSSSGKDAIFNLQYHNEKYYVSGSFENSLHFYSEASEVLLSSAGEKDGYLISLENCVAGAITAMESELADITICTEYSLNSPSATNECGVLFYANSGIEFPINESGTYELSWIFDDGFENTLTQNQTIHVVIPDDVIEPILTILPIVSQECSIDSLEAPLAFHNCLDPIVATTDIGFPITSLGVTEIIWTYENPFGVNFTQTQQVEITEDNTAPEAVVLEELTSVCMLEILTPPTTTDNCTGEITASTTTELPLTENTSIEWIFDDGNGNNITVSQNIVITTINTNVFQTGTILTAEVGNNENYTFQWIDCINNSPIPDAATHEFEPTINGEYALELHINGCTEVSDCFEVNGIGLEEQNPIVVTVYPNPNTGSFQIKTNKVCNEPNIIIYDIRGEKVFNKSYQNTFTILCEPTLPKGYYTIKLYSAGQELFSEKLIQL